MKRCGRTGAVCTVDSGASGRSRWQQMPDYRYRSWIGRARKSTCSVTPRCLPRMLAVEIQTCRWTKMSSWSARPFTSYLPIARVRPPRAVSQFAAVVPMEAASGSTWPRVISACFVAVSSACWRVPWPSLSLSNGCASAHGICKTFLGITSWTESFEILPGVLILGGGAVAATARDIFVLI